MGSSNSTLTNKERGNYRKKYFERKFTPEDLDNSEIFDKDELLKCRNH
jgi:hypothetical protein